LDKWGEWVHLKNIKAYLFFYNNFTVFGKNIKKGRGISVVGTVDSAKMSKSFAIKNFSPKY
jgi:hypothetical protein